MGEGFSFSNPHTNLSTTSCITTPQFTGLVPDSAPNMVLEIVTIIQVGFSGYRIGTTKFKTLCSLGFSQFATTYPSLGFMGVENLPDANLSVQEAHPLPSLGKLYTSAHSSTVHFSGSLLSVPFDSLERSQENFLTISSLLRLYKRVNKPSQPIWVRSSTSINFST